MRRRNKQNKGFTLVEVLIAITILSIVVIPMAHVFWQAVNGNSKAKKTYDATVVAQRVMEEYKFTSIEDILKEHRAIDASYVEDVTDGAHIYDSFKAYDTPDENGVKDGLEDKYVFQALELDDDGNYKKEGSNYYVSGANNQKYVVTVTVTPEEYKSTGTQTLINSYKVPNLTDLYNGNNIVVTDEYYRYDNFASAQLHASPDVIRKATEVEIITEITQDNVSAKYQYSTSCYLHFTYTAPGATPYSVDKYVAAKSYIQDAGTIPGIYVLYKPYNNPTGGAKSNDTMTIKHTYIMNGAPMTMINQVAEVHVIPSNVEGSTSTNAQLNSANVTTLQVYKNSESDTEQPYTGKDIVKLYGDIEGFANGLTASDKKENTLYGIRVVVEKIEKNGTLTQMADISSAKEADYAK